MRTVIEHATARTAHEVEAVLTDMHAGRVAARRLGASVVQRGPDNQWRPAAPWQGSHAATEEADRRLRLRLAARELPAPIGLDADRARRLRVAEAEVTINPLTPGRRDTVRPFWLGFGVSR